jgi:hypothetical protein
MTATPVGAFPVFLVAFASAMVTWRFVITMITWRSIIVFPWWFVMMLIWWLVAL